MGVLFIVTTTPVMVVYFFLAINKYDGKILDPILNVFSERETFESVLAKLPKPTLQACYIAAIWFAFQVSPLIYFEAFSAIFVSFFFRYF